MLIQKIPYFNECFERDQIASELRKQERFSATFLHEENMTPADMANLTVEFNRLIQEDLAKAKKDYNTKVAELSKLNTQAFIDHPKEVAGELQDPSWTLSEMMISRNIGKYKVVRKGKGVLIDKGTDYPAILSNFDITITIGKVIYTYNINSRNDSHSKAEILEWAYSEVVRSVLGYNP
jgi:hypothetical protein